MAELTEEQLRACRDAVSFAGYSYFADRGPGFLNELLDALTRAVKEAAESEGAVQ